MGLDTTVYRNLANLPAYLRERVTVEPGSGEVYLRDAREYGLFDLPKTKAWHEYLGNIALVAFIRNEIAKRLETKIAFYRRRLFITGFTEAITFHSHKSIFSFDEISELEKITRDSRSPELSNFIAQMRNLIAAANREGNGIVF